jgi:putative hemolysin
MVIWRKLEGVAEMRNMHMVLTVCMVLAVMAAGCVNHESGQAADPAAAVVRPANPAVKKCLEDGYVVEPVMENGVPVDHRCINPETGKACGVWEYYRDACMLE